MEITTLDCLCNFGLYFGETALALNLAHVGKGADPPR